MQTSVAELPDISASFREHGGHDNYGGAATTVLGYGLQSRAREGEMEMGARVTGKVPGELIYSQASDWGGTRRPSREKGGVHGGRVHGADNTARGGRRREGRRAGPAPVLSWAQVHRGIFPFSFRQFK